MEVSDRLVAAVDIVPCPSGCYRTELHRHLADGTTQTAYRGVGVDSNGEIVHGPAVHSYSATVLREGDCNVVTEADPVIHVHADLWREMAEDAHPDPALGQAVLDIDGGTLTFGTNGMGLGRLTYRFLHHDLAHAVYVYERTA